MTNSRLPDPLDGWDVTGTHLGLADYRADFRATEAALTSLIKRLYAKSEDLATFFAREVAPLPPPHVGAAS